MPKRVQRKRTKGWRMPANTVYVGRPTKWGNPYRLEKRDGGRGRINMWGFQSIIGDCDSYVNFYIEEDAQKEVVEYYKRYIKHCIAAGKLDISELKGRDLADWCSLDQPCHADVLLELANKESEAKNERR